MLNLSLEFDFQLVTVIVLAWDMFISDSEEDKQMVREEIFYASRHIKQGIPQHTEDEIESLLCQAYAQRFTAEDYLRRLEKMLVPDIFRSAA